MKPIDIERCDGLDRLATWNEVRRAIEFSSQDALKLMEAGGDFCDMNSCFSGHARHLPEEAMWLAIVSEMPDSLSN
jgi:hypothetical protein